MCELTTLATMALVSSTLGAGMSAISQYQAGKYNAAVAQNQQVIAQNNQILAQRNQNIAKQNADLALEQGQAQEQAQRQKTAQMIGAERAAMGASGVDLGSGSALSVQTSTAETGELDALTIRNNSMLQSRNYLNQAENFGTEAMNFANQASSYGVQAELANSQANWGVANSILGGASGVSDKWLSYQRWGVLGGSKSGVYPYGYGYGNMGGMS